MKDLIILKIGGSVITAKQEGEPIIKDAVILRIAKEIKKAQKYKQFNLILVHGVGSFGHKLAKEYRLWEGISKKSQIIPFAKTQLQTITLNSRLQEIFISVGLPAISVNPTSVVLQGNTKLLCIDTKAIEHFLKLGFMPTLHGAVVPDKKIGGSICSGDTILTYLSGLFKAKLAVFATDVDGIFTNDPRRIANTKLISEINNRNYENVIRGTEKSASKIDVGGGMKGKLEEIHRLSRGVETWIVNGEKKDVIAKALVQKKVFGTKILLK